MMGAPNLIRGGSHSGNVAASDLASGWAVLDIMSSDYVPAALLLGAVRLGLSSGKFSQRAFARSHLHLHRQLGYLTGARYELAFVQI